MSGGLLVRGARVRTMDGGRPGAAAFFVRDGRFVAVGGAAEAEAVAGAVGGGVRELDAGGRVVTPGLIDAHTHVALAADRALEVGLTGLPRAESLARIAAAHARLTPGAWLVGSGQREADWDGPADRATLDAIVGDRPACFGSRDAHALWVSSGALAAAGITRTTADPPGGRIGRDPTGEPDGRLFENAIGLVRRLVPVPGPERRAAALEAVLRDAAACGVTALHDFEGVDVWERLLALRAAGRLPVRVAFGFFLGGLGSLAGRIAELPPAAVVDAAGDDRLRAFALKGVLDGSLGAGTAHLIEPAAAGTDTGLSTLTPDEARAQGDEARRRGLGLALHAIGDAAVRAALDAFAAWPAADRARLRPRVEHAQLVADPDVARFGGLGVVASMQPSHCVADRALARAAWGERAARGGYAWRRLADGGARLAFGSDAPVEALDPRAGLHAAVTGGDPEAHARGATPARALTLDAAFAAYTTGAAWAARDEHRLGRIAPGLLADFVVWEDDPWAVAELRLPALAVASTWVAGSPAV